MARKKAEENTIEEISAEEILELYGGEEQEAQDEGENLETIEDNEKEEEA